jgi:phage tail sheath protein FI
VTDRPPIRSDLKHEGTIARPAPSNSELNEVELRRYVAYLEHSLDTGTQWAVFEPNGEALWARVRTTVTDFLTNEWRSGTLQGAAADQAFFVRCDRSTMTQNDLDNGRLNIVVGVAPVKPAEFVIFNIGQWTAGHKP